jgi:hypothetical protein
MRVGILRLIYFLYLLLTEGKIMSRENCALSAPFVRLLSVLVCGSIFMAGCSKQQPLSFPSNRGAAAVFLEAPKAAQSIDYGKLLDGHRSFDRIELKNGNIQFVFWKEGKEREVQEYFPGRGSRPPRKHAEVSFDANGLLLSEDIFFPSGHVEKRGRRLKNGSYESSSFFDNGVLQDYVLADATGNVVHEKIKRPDTTLAFSNDLDAKGIRTTRHYDLQGQLLDEMVATTPDTGDFKFFYPGTHVERMFGTFDFSASTANYLRRDGTIQYVEKLNYSTFEISVKDSTGKVELYVQSWSYSRDVNGQKRYQIFYLHIPKHGSVPDRVVLFDDSGQTIKTVTDNKVTFDGITYNRVDYQYAHNILQSADFFNDQGDKVRSEFPPSKQKVKPDVPDEYLKLRPLDSIPIPLAPSGYE